MIEILIVEDEKSILNLLRLNLTKAGYCCTVAENGMDAANILEKKSFDLVLLDIMLPEIDGYELLEYIKPMNIPVIFITAKASLDDRVKGLNSGVEDYIVKPFEIVELLARVNIVLRRNNKADSILKCNDIVIDVNNHIVKQSGKEIELTNKEFELLLLLVRNKNITLFRERIYEEIWGTEYPVESRTLDLHIQRLRRKIYFNECLKTIYKTGYRLEENKQ